MDGQPATTRLFLALWPDPAVRDVLRTWRDAWSLPSGAAPVPDGKLHLTLHFLGNQPVERVPELAAGFAVPFTPFNLDVGRPAVWPGGIAVLEPHAEPDALLRLHADLAGALLALDLAPEARSFRPHVTMARRAARAVPPAGNLDMSWLIAGYALVESRPGNGGAYQVLRTYS